MAQTVFDRLRAYETEGKPLHDLIVRSCDTGNELVAALQGLIRLAEAYRYTAGMGPNQLARLHAAQAAIARAYATNGDTPDNGAKAA